MANVNKVILIGRLTADPELKYTNSGSAVANINIAVNRVIPGRDGGESREEVCFVPVTVWGKSAEALAQYMAKGREIYIEGRLTMNQWEDQQTGQKRSKILVTAERVQFLGSKQGGGGGQAQEDQGAEPPAPQDVPF